MDHARTIPRERDRSGRSRTRLTVAVFVLAAFAAVAIIATTPRDTSADRTSTIEDGGLEWGEVVVIQEDEGSTIEAAVSLDDDRFPVADSRDDRFVLFQLGAGRFDSPEHVDDTVAERVIGLGQDDSIPFTWSADVAAKASTMPRAGEYSMSLDGTVEYRDVPEGTWMLRAFVVDRDGNWDGEVAVRPVDVP